MKYFLLSSLLFVLYFHTYAQPLSCGMDQLEMTTEEKTTALQFYQQKRPTISHQRATDSIALSIHMVKSVAVSPAPFSYEEIASEVEVANRAFGPGITLYICSSPREIAGKDSYSVGGVSTVNSRNYIPNTINIYIVEDVVDANGVSRGGYAWFPWMGDPSDRYVVMNEWAWGNGTTLAHELGHFFGLFHTHSTINEREYVDGSNCDRAGDLICDTPADPDLSRVNAVSNTCLYTGNFVDPKGMPYTPSVANHMSYSPQNCRRFFSSGQKEVMLAINQNENNYLTGKCEGYPDLGVKTDVDKMSISSVDKIDIEYTFDFKEIEKDQEVQLTIVLLNPSGEQGGALLYKEPFQVKVGQNSFSQSFSLDFPLTKGTGSYEVAAILDSDRELIELTESNNIAITELEVDNGSLEDAILFPNPVEDEFKLFMRDKRATGSFIMQIFSADGRLIREEDSFKRSEELFQIVDVQDFLTGLYIVRIKFEKVSREFAWKFVKN